MRQELTLNIDDTAKVFGDEPRIELKILIEGANGLWVASEGNMIGSGATPAQAVSALLSKRFESPDSWHGNWDGRQGF